MNLGHSNEQGIQADDETDYMGYSYPDYQEPLMCFNPAKSYQLGWYTNQQQSINPLVQANSDNNDAPRKISLRGALHHTPLNGYMTLMLLFFI